MKRKRVGGAATFILALYAIIMISLHVCFTSHIRNLDLLGDRFGSGLVLSLLGAATINLEEYGSTGNRVIHGLCTEEDILNAPENAQPDSYVWERFDIFRKLLMNNLGLDEHMMSSSSLVESAVEIERFSIFNVYKSEETGDSRTYALTYDDGIWSGYTYPINEIVTILDHSGVARPMTATTLYAEISFVIPVFPFYPDLQAEIPEEAKTIRVHMRRIVAVPEN